MDTFDVILTEFLANTTLSQIVNDVNDDGDQVIRRISQQNVKVSMVKPSNEALYPGSIIVLTKGEN